MKRLSWHKIFYTASIILIAVFALAVLWDYHTYSTTLNSAPFYVWVLADSIYLLLPALLCGIAGLLCQRHNKQIGKD